MLTFKGYIDGIHGTPYIPAPWIQLGYLITPTKNIYSEFSHEKWWCSIAMLVYPEGRYLMIFTPNKNGRKFWWLGSPVPQKSDGHPGDPHQVTMTLRIDSVHEGSQAREHGGLRVVTDGHLRCGRGCIGSRPGHGIPIVVFFLPGHLLFGRVERCIEST